MRDRQKLLVIGGGAAGFFCAVNAARLHRQLEVVIMEKSNKTLAKVKVSGGGRCNVTHACFQVGELAGKYPRGGHFLKKTFRQFFTADTIRWFEERGARLKIEEDGRIFPVTDQSQTIIDCLHSEAEQYGVLVKKGISVTGIRNTGKGFEVLLNGEERTFCDFICVACGGFPKLAQFDWLKALGHSVEEPVPSLFTFNMPRHPLTALPGISVKNVMVKIQGEKITEEGPLLITHWGISGPAVLRLSAWGARTLSGLGYHFTAVVNWLPDWQESSLREKFQSLRFEIGAQKMYSRNPFKLPQRLWQFFLEQAGIGEGTRWADLAAKAQNKLIRWLVSAEFPVEGKTTFKEEFVTCGGISLEDIDPLTMQSRIVPHLFFAGEVMDVDGITGGFNFQHAWTSGWIAANAIAQLLTAKCQ